MALGILSGSAQTIGKRDEQQDASAFTDGNDSEFVEHGGVLSVVADGIGGHAHGGQASRKAVEAFVRDYASKPRMSNIPDALYHALKQANRAVLEFAESQGEAENCGTTLVAAVIHPDTSTLHWTSVGDSRLYFFREEQFVQFTLDANYGCQLIRRVARGTLARVELNSEENPHKLTSFLGIKKLVKIDRSIRPFPLHEGDRVLLCTDGFYQALGKEELIECYFQEPQAACDRAVQRILRKDLENQDNATAAILAFGLLESQKKVLPSIDETNQGDEEDKQSEPLITHTTVSTTRWLLLGVMAVGLLLLLGGVWLGVKQDEASEDKKTNEVKLPALSKPPARSPSPPWATKAIP